MNTLLQIKQTNNEIMKSKDNDVWINVHSDDKQVQLWKEFDENKQTVIDREEIEEVEADVTSQMLAQLMAIDNIDKQQIDKDKEGSGLLLFGYRWNDIKWTNVIWLVFLHITFLWSYFYLLTEQVKVYTVLWTVFLSTFSGFGMSVGAHRYWAHRGFKSVWLLRLIMLILQTMTINGSAFSYARDHRNHHKWPATHADPKNPGRGFFFAHIGWWMLKKRPEVAFYGRKVPIDDMLEDKLLMFQHRFYIPLVILIAFALPITIPIIVWHEDIRISVALCFIRIVVVLHHLFTVNSVAHFWGLKPYNRFMKPTENHIINWISFGEGNHNYHHTFPFDYRNSEYVWWEVFNPASLFIHSCQMLGLASEPRKASKGLINNVIESKGIPEYFVDIHRRRLWMRIILGIIDWISGLFLAQWPLWVAMIFKMIMGYKVFVF